MKLPCAALTSPRLTLEGDLVFAIDLAVALNVGRKVRGVVVEIDYQSVRFHGKRIEQIAYVSRGQLVKRVQPRSHLHLQHPPRHALTR